MMPILQWKAKKTSSLQSLSKKAPPPQMTLKIAPSKLSSFRVRLKQRCNSIYSTSFWLKNQMLSRESWLKISPKDSAVKKAL